MGAAKDAQGRARASFAFLVGFAFPGVRIAACRTRLRGKPQRANPSAQTPLTAPSRSAIMSSGIVLPVTDWCGPARRSPRGARSAIAAHRAHTPWLPSPEGETYETHGDRPLRSCELLPLAAAGLARVPIGHGCRLHCASGVERGSSAMAGLSQIEGEAASARGCRGNEDRLARCLS